MQLFKQGAKRRTLGGAQTPGGCETSTRLWRTAPPLLVSRCETLPETSGDLETPSIPTRSTHGTPRTPDLLLLPPCPHLADLLCTASPQVHYLRSWACSSGSTRASVSMPCARGRTPSASAGSGRGAPASPAAGWLRPRRGSEFSTSSAPLPVYVTLVVPRIPDC